MATSSQNSGGFVPPTIEELNADLPAYEVISELGRGGMGAVFKARQISLDRLVAIKILPDIEDTEGFRFADRFRREAQSMAKLAHPNIISVHDFGQTEPGQFYFVMEFIDGTDLDKVIRSGEMTIEHIYSWLPQICQALQYAHENGIVHRDIKPANIMITQEGAVKIADFGLAKQTGPTEALSQLTMDDVTMGTPDYVAPEALELGVELDHRADLYSLGVMIYQMLTGKVPRGMFTMPSKLKPELDPRIDDLVARTMEANREARFQNAAEVESCLYEIQTTAMEKEPEEPAPAPAGKKLIMGAAPVARPVEADPVPSVLRAPQKSSAPIVVMISLGALAVIGTILFLVFGGGDGEIANSDPRETPDPDPGSGTVAVIPPIDPEPEPISPTVPDPDPVGPPDPIPEKPPTDPAPGEDPVIAGVDPPTDPGPAAGPTPPTGPAGPDPTPEVTADPPAGPGGGTTEPVAEPDLSEAEKRIAAIDQRLEERFDEVAGNQFRASVSTLNQGYSGALERARSALAAAGNLDAVVMVENEIKEIETQGDKPVTGTLPAAAPPVLKENRTKYNKAVAEYRKIRDAEVPKLLEGYDVLLQQLQKELTREEKIAEAKTVQIARKRIQTDGHPLLPKVDLPEIDLTEKPEEPTTTVLDADVARLLKPQRGRLYGYGDLRPDYPLKPLTDTRGKFDPEIKNLIRLITTGGHVSYMDHKGAVTIGVARLPGDLEFVSYVVSYRCGAIGVLKNGRIHAEFPDMLNATTSVDPKVISDAVDVASALWCQALLRKDGTVLAWKFNGPGKLADLPRGEKFAEIFGGGEHLLIGKKLDGTFASLNPEQPKNDELVSKLNGLVSPVIKVSLGHPSLILTEDGKVFQFEEIDLVNMVDVPGDLPHAIDIRAGYKVSAARMRDGTWRAWGTDKKGTIEKINSLGADVYDLAATDEYVLWLK